MTKKKFIEKLIQMGNQIKDELSATLCEPPGRTPSEHDLERSKWFRNLSPYDQSKVLDVARVAAQAAFFDLLCELDGVGGVAGNPHGGMFVLQYIEKDKSYFLNDPKEELLHDAYRAMIEW
jgi:hypothetical protein